MAAEDEFNRQKIDATIERSWGKDHQNVTTITLILVAFEQHRLKGTGYVSLSKAGQNEKWASGLLVSWGLGCQTMLRKRFGVFEKRVRLARCFEGERVVRICPQRSLRSARCRTSSRGANTHTPLP